MIRIQKNPEVPLKIPEFLCDTNSVGEHLNHHPLLQLLNCYGFLLIIGRPKQGKTSLAISLMTQSEPKIYKKTHHHNLIVMPSNSIHSLKKNPFKGLPEENFYDELDIPTMESIHSRIDEWSKEDEKTLLLIDDQTASLKSSKYVEDMLKKLVYNRRHLKLNIIMTVQSFINVPLDLRKNIQNMILFKPSKKEFQLVFDELMEQKKNKALEVMKLTYDDSTKHNFLFLHIESQRMFKNFDEIIIDDET